MNIYIAARYSRKDEAQDLAHDLVDLGHSIASTWIYQVEDEMLYEQGPGAAGRFARKDLTEVAACELLVALSEEESNPWGRGGRHVEFGYALGLKKSIIVIGPKENLFHYLPGITHFATTLEFIDDCKMGVTY